MVEAFPQKTFFFLFITAPLFTHHYPASINSTFPRGKPRENVLNGLYDLQILHLVGNNIRRPVYAGKQLIRFGIIGKFFPVHISSHEFQSSVETVRNISEQG